MTRITRGSRPCGANSGCKPDHREGLSTHKATDASTHIRRPKYFLGFWERDVFHGINRPKKRFRISSGSSGKRGAIPGSLSKEIASEKFCSRKLTCYPNRLRERRLGKQPARGIRSADCDLRLSQLGSSAKPSLHCPGFLRYPDCQRGVRRRMEDGSKVGSAGKAPSELKSRLGRG